MFDEEDVGVDDLAPPGGDYPSDEEPPPPPKAKKAAAPKVCHSLLSTVVWGKVGVVRL